MLNRLEIVRGTTNTFQIEVVDVSGTAYNLAANERIIFGVKKNAEDDELIFQQTAEIIGEGLFTVKIAPEKTECLKCGKYSYDVGLESGEEYFNVIEPSTLVILPNVTFRGCAD